jgi:DNA-binding transcriptional LysR family regulator
VLDLVQVRSFLEVAERGTIAAAAAALGYTAPAVTQQVGKLEQRLGTPLFDRAGGRLRLNSAGTGLLPLANELLDLARRAEEIVRQTPERERVVIGGIASAVAALVVPRLKALAKLADIEIVEAEDAGALRELRLGHIDLALIQEYPEDAGHRHNRLLYNVVLADPLRLILPPSWPVTTTLEEALYVPWLVNGTGTRCERATREILANRGVEPTLVGDVTDNHLLLSLVSAGHGATIVPELVLANTDLDVTISSHDLSVSRSLVAVTRDGPSMTSAAVISTLVGGP